jgi:hypothetical protein
MRNLPTSPACQLVPQATMWMRWSPFRSSAVKGSGRGMGSPASMGRRLSSVFEMAWGCSKISFCMKCLNPPFSAATGS